MRSENEVKISKRVKLNSNIIAEGQIGVKVQNASRIAGNHVHLILTFRSQVMKKNVLFDPKMTSDLLTVLFEYIPLLHTQLDAKYQMCQNFALRVIAI